MKQLVAILMVTMLFQSATDVQAEHAPLVKKGCVTPDNFSLALRAQPQERESWCGVATAQIVMRSHGKSLEQCDLATTALRNDPDEGDRLALLVVGRDINVTKPEHKESCCNTPETHAPQPCLDGIRPELIFDPYRFHYFEFRTPSKETALAWDDLKDQLFCKGLPFIFVWADEEDSPQHAMVAIGYEETANGLRFVHIYDPLQRAGSRITYETFVLGTGGMGHYEDYVEIHPR